MTPKEVVSAEEYGRQSLVGCDPNLKSRLGSMAVAKAGGPIDVMTDFEVVTLDKFDQGLKGK